MPLQKFEAISIELPALMYVNFFHSMTFEKHSVNWEGTNLTDVIYRDHITFRHVRCIGVIIKCEHLIELPIPEVSSKDYDEDCNE